MSQAVFQFARVHAHQCLKADALLKEATREVGFCPHVLNPRPPTIVFGSEAGVRVALQEVESTPQRVRKKNGDYYYRKPRSDFRGFMDGVFSFPIRTSEFRQRRQEFEPMFRPWFRDVIDFAKSEFGSNLKLALLHGDEDFPHLHAFVVGPAQHLHPGLRAEVQDGVLLADGKLRVRRHRAGLRDFLDRYHESVGKK